MKTYTVNVNGTQYSVEIELIDGAQAASAQAAAPTPQPVASAPAGG